MPAELDLEELVMIIVKQSRTSQQFNCMFKMMSLQVPLATLSLKELDTENKHWLKAKVKLDMKAVVVDLKSDQKFHPRKGEPYSEEEEHKIIEWILVRERLQPRNWSVGGKTFHSPNASNTS